jgi:hypothetical protein
MLVGALFNRRLQRGEIVAVLRRPIAAVAAGIRR